MYGRTQTIELNRIAETSGVTSEEFVRGAGMGLPVTTSVKAKANEPTVTITIRTTEATAASAYKTRAVLLSQLGVADTGMLDADQPGLNAMVDDPAYVINDAAFLAKTCFNTTARHRRYMPPDELISHCMSRLYSAEDTGQDPAAGHVILPQHAVAAAAADVPGQGSPQLGAHGAPVAAWEAPWTIMSDPAGTAYAQQMMPQQPQAAYMSMALAPMAGGPNPPVALPMLTRPPFDPTMVKRTVSTSSSPEHEDVSTPVARSSLVSDVSKESITPTTSPDPPAKGVGTPTTPPEMSARPSTANSAVDWQAESDEEFPGSLNSSFGDIRTHSLDLRTASVASDTTLTKLAKNGKEEEARRVLTEPVSPEKARKPTSYWAGNWLSRSMPESELDCAMRAFQVSPRVILRMLACFLDQPLVSPGDFDALTAS